MLGVIKSMKKLIILFFVIISYNYSIGCTCSGAGEYSDNERSLEWWNNSEYVFRAKLDSAITDQWTQELFFTLTKKFKGEIEDNISFFSPMFGTSCEWNLQDKVDKEFIIYGYVDDRGNLVSHFCSGSKQIMSQVEIDSLTEFPFYRQILNQEMKFIEDISKYKDGLVKTYYSNGNITAKGNFSNFQPVGYWKYYSFQGKITSEGRYKNYKKDGIWIENIYVSESFTNKTGEIEYKLASNGYKKGKYSNGLKIGLWHSYNKEGDLITVE